jgi:hypothetical protein
MEFVVALALVVAVVVCLLPVVMAFNHYNESPEKEAVKSRKVRLSDKVAIDHAK